MKPHVARRSALTLVSTVFVVTFALFWFFDQPTSESHTHQDADASPKIETYTIKSFAKRDYPPRRTQVAWTLIENEETVDRTEWPKAPDFATFVHLNRQFDQWLLGTPVQIHNPTTGQIYAAEVDRIVPNGAGSHTIHASPAEGEQELDRLILTFNDSSTLAYVFTKAGNWELNGNADVGWIVSSSDLKRNRTYGETDVLNERYNRYADAEYVPRRSD